MHKFDPAQTATWRIDFELIYNKKWAAELSRWWRVTEFKWHTEMETSAFVCGGDIPIRVCVCVIETFLKCHINSRLIAFLIDSVLFFSALLCPVLSLKLFSWFQMHHVFKQTLDNNANNMWWWKIVILSFDNAKLWNVWNGNKQQQFLEEPECSGVCNNDTEEVRAVVFTRLNACLNIINCKTRCHCVT